MAMEAFSFAQDLSTCFAGNKAEARLVLLPRL